MTDIRTAYVTITNPSDRDIKRIAAYLPANYQVAEVDGKIRISGKDYAGWTLDGYVIPRLASGLIWATEATEEATI